MMYKLLPAKEEKLLFFRLDGEAAVRYGAIGYLRADFGKSGREFYSAWFDNRPHLKTQGFKKEFDGVINSLRGDGREPPFADRASLEAFCAVMPGKELAMRGGGYTVRTHDYSYYFRCLPRSGDYDIYCFAYDNRWLLSELAGKHELPRKCFGILPSSGDMILITCGERKYTPFSSTATPEEKRRMVDIFNEANGVTQAQEEAMLAGSMFGFGVPAACPWNYEQDGTPRIVAAEKQSRERSEMSETKRSVITTANIEEFIGKTIDCKRGMFHHYPLTFSKINGEYFYTDRNEVTMPFHDNEGIFFDSVRESSRFNAYPPKTRPPKDYER